jgi:hypothetical protein
VLGQEIERATPLDALREVVAVEGIAVQGFKPGTISIVGRSHRAMRAEPLVNHVMNFGH